MAAARVCSIAAVSARSIRFIASISPLHHAQTV
jgi:hypothetical protein